MSRPPAASLTLTLGALARRVGLARSSVLHYEALGLLSPATRSEAGYRLYGAAELARLQAICRLREAGLALADIRALLVAHAPRPGAPCGPRPAELLQRRLLGLCDELERLRSQQRLLARLLADPALRDETRPHDKASWVALLRRAGFDDEAMLGWHAAFEQEQPAAHADFLASLGLASAEVDEIRRRAATADAAGT